MIILAQDVATDLMKYITQGGSVAVLATFTFFWLSGKIIRRGELDRVIAERDRLEQLLWKVLNLTETAADSAKRATDLAGVAVRKKEDNERSGP